MLFAPCCSEFSKSYFLIFYFEQAIDGRVIRVIQKFFHCQLCQVLLVETEILKYNRKFVFKNNILFCKIKNSNLYTK
jgi:hypothetical protein